MTRAEEPWSVTAIPFTRTRWRLEADGLFVTHTDAVRTQTEEPVAAWKQRLATILRRRDEAVENAASRSRPFSFCEEGSAPPVRA
jgi:hypothetical protein